MKKKIEYKLNLLNKKDQRFSELLEKQFQYFGLKAMSEKTLQRCFS